MPKRQRASGQSEDRQTGGPRPRVQGAVLPFEEQEVVIKMSLLPSAMDDLAKNIQGRLTSMLMKYQEDAGGVILSLSNPRLPAEHPHASILDDLPFLHVHVTATALVFKPAPGLKLQGKIIKVAGTHIALLVYGIFNAAISEEDMGDGFHFRPAQKHWEDEESGRSYQVGDSMDFTVKKLHEAGGLISIDGTVRPPDAPPRVVVGGIGAGASAASLGMMSSSQSGGAGHRRSINKQVMEEFEDGGDMMMEVEPPAEEAGGRRWGPQNGGGGGGGGANNQGGKKKRKKGKAGGAFGRAPRD